MQSLNIYDYLVLAVYMLMMVWIGFYFTGRMKSDSDYFRAGNSLTWWIAALSAYMSAFSSYMFTGGAGLVYQEGITGAVILWFTGLAIFTGYLVFAKLWRRSRVTTVLEFLEERFNLVTHQVASWVYIPLYIVYCGVVLYSLGIFISSALGLDIFLIIWVSALVILLYTILGGVWAVSMTDTIQFLFLLPICLLLIPLSLLEVHGPLALVHNTPANYFHFPSAHYPWYWLIGYLILLIHGQNTNPIAQRYFSVRDEAEARKVALACTVLFTVGLVIWAVPPMAARVLFPDLSQLISLPNPHEGAYVAIAARVLPHGLLGLLVAAIFAAAMSSVSGVYNVVSAVLTRDIVQRLSRREFKPRTLLLVGQVSTLMVGAISTLIGLKMASAGEGSFRVMVKFSALTGTPLAAPMLLGFLFRRPSAWSGLVSFVTSGAAAMVFAFCTPLNAWLAGFGEPVAFTITVFTILGIGVVAFFTTGLFLPNSPEDERRINAFFTKLATPVDAVREVSAQVADHSPMARFVGAMTMVMALMVAAFLLIPATPRDRLVNLILFLVLAVFGVWMYLGPGKARRA